jgi:hypothetical protein
MLILFVFPKVLSIFFIIYVRLLLQKVKKGSEVIHEWKQLEAGWCDIIGNAVKYNSFSSDETTFNLIIVGRI